MKDPAADWARFVQSGSIFDYLNYKAGQLTQEDAYANCNNGADPAPGQGGGGGPHPDDPDA